MTLRVTSLNTNGLGLQTKRRAIFDEYRTTSDILCLQETHCTEEIEQIWSNEWGGCAFYSHGTSSARGVAILVNRRKYINVKQIKKDTGGRFLIMDFESDGLSCTLVNLYAPKYRLSWFFYRNK